MENKFELPPKAKTILKGIFLSFVWIVPLLVAVDQGTKWAVQLNLKPGDSVPVIENFFYLTLVYNTGSAGGLGSSSTAMRVVFILISWIMSIFFGFWLFHIRKKNERFLNFIVSLCLAGAIGNLIDRTFYWPETTGFTGVIDFLMFYLQGGPNGPSVNWLSPFPVFNVADMCLTVGVILFIVYILFFSKKDEDRQEEHKKEHSENASK